MAQFQQNLTLGPSGQSQIDMARALMQQGRQNQNVRTPLEAIGKTLQGLRGQQMMEDAQEQQKQRRDAYARTMRNVATAGSEGTVTGPGGGGTGETATAKQRMIDYLSANPDTAPTAAQMQLSQALQPEQARTQTEREIQRYLERGYSRGVAEDIAYGNIDVETDQFGNTYLVNKATGNRRVLRGEGGGQGSGQGGGREQPTQPEAQPGDAQGTDLGQAAEEGTGPFSMGRAAINSVVGPFIEGTPFPETARSRAAIRNFNQTAKQALVNSDRFPVYEQKIVQQLLPNPDQFFNDPDAEREKLTEMRGFLQRKKGRIQESMESGGVTTGERGELSNQVATIDRILGLMEPMDSGEQGAQFTMESPAQPATQEEYEQLPSGAYFRDDEGLKRKP